MIGGGITGWVQEAIYTIKYRAEQGYAYLPGKESMEILEELASDSFEQLMETDQAAANEQYVSYVKTIMQDFTLAHDAQADSTTEEVLVDDAYTLSHLLWICDAACIIALDILLSSYPGPTTPEETLSEWQDTEWQELRELYVEVKDILTQRRDETLATSYEL